MVTQIEDRPVEVLLVEDNPADARLAQDTIEQSSQEANITHAEDGEIALAILRKEGEYASAPRPDLILLDLRMPRKDGTEVLAELNADEDLVSIPVMLLTDRHGGGGEPAGVLFDSSQPLCAKASPARAVQPGPGRARSVQPSAHPDTYRIRGASGNGARKPPPMVVALRINLRHLSGIHNPDTP